VTHELDALLTLEQAVPGTFTGRLTGDGLIGHAINGGVLLAVIGRVLRTDQRTLSRRSRSTVNTSRCRGYSERDQSSPRDGQ
jgi:hypothetical protein